MDELEELGRLEELEDGALWELEVLEHLVGTVEVTVWAELEELGVLEDLDNSRLSREFDEPRLLVEIAVLGL